MEQSKIERINFLAKKSRTSEGLTDDERAEQKSLRQEYINSYVRSLENQLDNTYIVDEEGHKTKLERKE
jgi:uncharacterized protein YnzC (UPF0291/DUF896 family)